MTATPRAVPRRLCALDALPEPGSRGFGTGSEGCGAAFFVVRRGQTVRAYRNRCPHMGLNLEWLPDNFLDEDGEFIVCASHGACFRIEDGVCVAGPCTGERLEPVAVRVEDGQVLLDDPELLADPDTAADTRLIAGADQDAGIG